MKSKCQMRCRNKFGMTRNVILNSFQNPFSEFDIDLTFEFNGVSNDG